MQKRMNMNLFWNNDKEMDVKNIQLTIQTIAWDKICRPKSE